MRGLCAICFGRILMIDRGGGFRREGQGLRLGKIFLRHIIILTTSPLSQEPIS